MTPELASHTLAEYLREIYACWLCVGVGLNKLVVYYDEDAIPPPKIPIKWEGLDVIGRPTGIPTIGF